MDLLQKIKDDRTIARKAKDSHRAMLLTTLAGEAETALKGKQAARFDMLALVKKFSSNLEESLKIKYTEGGHTELCILAEYIPVQLTAADIKSIIDTEFEGDNLGKFMGYMNKAYKGHFDGKRASGLFKAYVLGE